MPRYFNDDAAFGYVDISRMPLVTFDTKKHQYLPGSPLVIDTAFGFFEHSAISYDGRDRVSQKSKKLRSLSSYRAYISDHKFLHGVTRHVKQKMAQGLEQFDSGAKKILHI